MKKSGLTKRIVLSCYPVWGVSYCVLVPFAAVVETLTAVAMWLGGKVGKYHHKLTFWQCLKIRFKGFSSVILWPTRKAYIRVLDKENNDA